MVGLESALRVVQQAVVDTGMLDWDDVARVMSAAPARIGRLAGAGTALAAGEPASFTLYDPAPVREFGAGPEMPVAISADKSVRYEVVVDVLDELKQRGIRAALMVKPKS